MVGFTGDWRTDIPEPPPLRKIASIGLVAHPDQRDAALAAMDRLVDQGETVELTLCDTWTGPIMKVFRNIAHVEAA